MTDPQAAGHVIGGKYQLVRCIGRGGMGSVWQAHHVTLGAPVALKLVDPALLRRQDIDPGEVIKRFLREAQAAAAVRSPHVVQILDHGIDGTTPWMALELLEGESLDQRIARVGALPHRDTARFITHVARALNRAHEAGLVHRDLKPSNVFLVQNEDEEIAKILDFGLVKMRRAPLAGHGSDLTAGRVLGTPYYMSPEQAQGHAVDHRTDLWAIGVIAFECATGRLPFETEVLTQLLVDICVKALPAPSRFASVPPGFDGWFAKATERDLERRFQTAREMAEALRAVLAPDESVSVIATGRFVLDQVARASVPADPPAPAAAPFAAPAPTVIDPPAPVAAPAPIAAPVPVAAPVAAPAPIAAPVPVAAPVAAPALTVIDAPPPPPAHAPIAVAVSGLSDSAPTLLRGPADSTPEQGPREHTEKTALSVSSDINPARFRGQRRVAVGVLALLAALGAVALVIGLASGPSEPDPTLAAPPAATPSVAPAQPTTPPPEPTPAASARPVDPTVTPAPTQRPRVPASTPTQKSKKDPRLGF